MKKEKDSLYAKLRKTTAGVALGLGLMWLAGCSGLGMYNGYTWTQKGEYKIITRNDDLYLERLDGSDSRRLTHTPDKISTAARYVVDGKYIVYGEANSNQFGSKYYIIPAEGDDSKRKEITEQEFIGFR